MSCHNDEGIHKDEIVDLPNKIASFRVIYCVITFLLTRPPPLPICAPLAVTRCKCVWYHSFFSAKMVENEKSFLGNPVYILH